MVSLCLPRIPEAQLAGGYKEDLPVLLETLGLPECCSQQGFSCNGVLQFSILEPTLPSTA